MDLDARGATGLSPRRRARCRPSSWSTPRAMVWPVTTPRPVPSRRNPARHVLLCGCGPGAVTGHGTPPSGRLEPTPPARGGELHVEWQLRRASNDASSRLTCSTAPGRTCWVVLLPGRDREPVAPAQAGRHRQGRVQRGVEAVPRRHARDARPRGDCADWTRSAGVPGAHDESGRGRTEVACDGAARDRPCPRLLLRSSWSAGPSARGSSCSRRSRPGEPLVVADRYDVIQRDPAWPPWHELMRLPAVGLVFAERSASRPRGPVGYPERLLRARAQTVC